MGCCVLAVLAGVGTGWRGVWHGRWQCLATMAHAGPPQECYNSSVIVCRGWQVLRRIVKLALISGELR